MHISELRIHNVKRIVALGIAPGTGEPVILTGDNAQGKSSVLDAIFLALQNKGLEDPIRHGSSKATVKLVIHGAEGEYLVERTITKKTRSLKITGKDGADIPSPQAFLDGLVGSLAFDPLQFVRMKPKAQAIAIRELVGLDTSALDTQYKEAFARRTEVNRTVSNAEAQLKDLTRPEVPEDRKEEEVGASALIAKRDTMTDAHTKATNAATIAVQALEAVNTAEARVEELRKELAAAENAVTAAKTRADQLAAVSKTARDSAPDAGAIAAITAQIADVDTTNEGIRARRELRASALRAVEAYDAKTEALKTARGSAETLTQSLATIEEKKSKLVRDAKMPVDGMTFDDDGVLIDDVRFDQLSTAEQVRVSAAVAMRGNPKLRLILVREGALLNKANLTAICDAAKEGDYQIFIEKFQEEPGSVGLHIEDGAITHVNGASVKSASELALEPASA